MAWTNLSVSGEEITSRGQRGQTSRHVGQEGKVGETLDVGFELFPHLGHPRQFLLILLWRKIKTTWVLARNH